MANTTLINLQYVSHIAGEGNTVIIAAQVLPFPGQDYPPNGLLDVTVTSWQGLPRIVLPGTKLETFQAIGELRVERVDGHDQLHFNAQQLFHLPVIPDWGDHVWSNLSVAEGYAYATANGNVGTVNDRDRIKDAGSSKVASRSMGCKVNNGKDTTWFKTEFWGKRAEIADKYLSSGRFSVSGRLKFNTYETKSGEFRIEPIITSDNLEMLGKGSGSNGNGNDNGTSYSGNEYVPAPPSFQENPVF